MFTRTHAQLRGNVVRKTDSCLQFYYDVLGFL